MENINEEICCRCGNDDNGGYSLPDGSFVCEDCLTPEEKVELGNYWSSLEGN